jgi:hypothetical protein
VKPEPERRTKREPVAPVTEIEPKRLGTAVILLALIPSGILVTGREQRLPFGGPFLVDDPARPRLSTRQRTVTSLQVLHLDTVVCHLAAPEGRDEPAVVGVVGPPGTVTLGERLRRDAGAVGVYFTRERRALHPRRGGEV